MKKRVASRIRLVGCQIKSLEIARAVADALDVVEKQAGIYSVHIDVEQCFVCPDINLERLNDTPMRRVFAGALKQQLALNRKNGDQ